MSYVKHILLPQERVVYDGHVHPKVLMGGLLLLALAAWILTEATHSGGGRSILLGFAYYLAEAAPSTSGFYNTLLHWQETSPGIALDVKMLALVIALAGFYRLLIAFIIMQTTELIVTDQRVIAKTGVFTINTIELDRRRISEVAVHQTLLGRIMGYGNLYIQGFTGAIGGLPPMANPHLVERFLS